MIAAYRPFALERRIDLDGWTTLVFVRRARAAPRRCRARPRPHRLPRMFEAQFQSFEDRSDRGESAPRVGGAARGTGAPRPRRLHRAARRPLPERIRAAERRAARLAHRFHRLGRPRHRARRSRRAVRRRPLSGAGARGSRQRDFFDRASGRAIRRRPGSKPICAPARSSAIRRGCTPSTAPSGSARPAPRPARASLRSTTIRSTPSGPTGRSRRSAPWCCTICAMPAKTPQAKLARVRAEMQKSTADTLLVADPHAVSWLFNIRGSDIPHTPVVLAFATVPKEGRPALFIDLRKLGNEVRSHLEEIADVRPNAAFERDLAALGKEHRRLRLDPATSAGGDRAARRSRTAARSCAAADPIAPMKAVKNAAEIAGARAAQQRDGAAVTRFLAWFDRNAPRGELTEIDAVEALESFRRDTGLLKDVSFPTIAGAGPRRRHRALPRHPQNQSPHRAGRTFSDRFRRPVRGRHHRHHAHHRRRRRPAPRCAATSRSCSRAISPSRARYFPKAPPARSSMRSRGNFSGRPGSISTTAPATASAAICRCTRGRRASPSSAAPRSSAA